MYTPTPREPMAPARHTVLSAYNTAIAHCTELLGFIDFVLKQPDTPYMTENNFAVLKSLRTNVSLGLHNLYLISSEVTSYEDTDKSSAEN